MHSKLTQKLLIYDLLHILVFEEIYYMHFFFVKMPDIFSAWQVKVFNPEQWHTKNERENNTVLKGISFMISNI